LASEVLDRHVDCVLTGQGSDTTDIDARKPLSWAAFRFYSRRLRFCDCRASKERPFVRYAKIRFMRYSHISQPFPSGCGRIQQSPGTVDSPIS
jgi:hypothetical protein